MAKQHVFAAVILGSFLISTGQAQTSSPSLIATPPQPTWSELSVPQKIVLAPLSDEWDSMESYRQKKWLGIVARFSSMTPDEQRRIQGQMQEWRKLTPQERHVARENYKTTRQLPAEKKQELKQKWEEYQNLPEEEKEKLKQQASRPSSKPARPGMPASTAAAAPSPPWPAHWKVSAFPCCATRCCGPGRCWSAGSNRNGPSA